MVSVHVHMCSLARMETQFLRQYFHVFHSLNKGMVHDSLLLPKRKKATKLVASVSDVGAYRSEWDSNEWEDPQYNLT